MVQEIWELSYLQVTFRDTLSALALPPALPLCTHNFGCTESTHLAERCLVSTHKGKYLYCGLTDSNRQHRMSSHTLRAEEGQESSAGAVGNTALLLGLPHLPQQEFLQAYLSLSTGQCQVILGPVWLTQVCFDKI